MSFIVTKQHIVTPNGEYCGVPCANTSISRMGAKYICGIFAKELGFGKEYRLSRCVECVEAEKESMK